MRLRDKLQSGQFVTTLELDPPKGCSPRPTIAALQAVRSYVDAVNIADCPMAHMRMSSIALASLLQVEEGIETIFHLTCRDRNVIGLQAELLGAAALGVMNVLTLTGDDPRRGDHPDAKPVFETDATGLLRLARNLQEGVDAMGHPLVDSPDFYLGTTGNPGTDDLAAEIERLWKKKEAGADFIQTQPVYDLERAHRFIEAVAPLGMPVLLGLIPLRSVKMARYLDEKVPGISLSQELLRRMEKGGVDEGIRIARETLEGIRCIAQGVHLMPLNHMDTALAILQAG